MVKNDDSGGQGSSDATVSEDSYKALQRKLNRSQDQVRELTRENVDASRALAGVSRIEAVLSSQLESSGDDEALATLQTRQKDDNATFTYRSELIDVLREYDADFSDETLNEARTLWDSGKPEEAIAATKKVLGAPAGEPGDIQALVAAELARINRGAAAGVDNGDSAGLGAGVGRPITREQLGNPFKEGQTPKELISDGKALLDSFYNIS